MKDTDHPLNNYNLFKGFDSNKSNKSIKYICHQFIHSEIFIPFIPFGKELVGIYFCSNKKKLNEIYYIQLVTIVELFLSVSLNEIKRIKLNVEGKTISVNGI